MTPELKPWHIADCDKPSDGRAVLLRVLKSTGEVLYIEGFYRGHEYGDTEAAITHYDTVTHWIDLP